MILQGNTVGTCVKLVYALLWQEQIITKDVFKGAIANQVT
jgi:hypothetical protein